MIPALELQQAGPTKAARTNTKQKGQHTSAPNNQHDRARKNSYSHYESVDIYAAALADQGEGQGSEDRKEDEDEGLMEVLASETMDSEGGLNLPKSVEKSVIIHTDENGFGLRVKGQAPVFVEHVHENGAAWRAGVRKWDQISKVNGTPVTQIDHKQVVLMFKACTRFVSLTLLTSLEMVDMADRSASGIGARLLFSRRSALQASGRYASSTATSATSSRRSHTNLQSPLIDTIPFNLASPSSSEFHHHQFATLHSPTTGPACFTDQRLAASLVSSESGATLKTTSHQNPKLVSLNAKHRSNSQSSFACSSSSAKANGGSSAQVTANYAGQSSLLVSGYNPTTQQQETPPISSANSSRHSSFAGAAQLAATARRSESVSVQPSYLSVFEDNETSDHHQTNRHKQQSTTSDDQHQIDGRPAHLINPPMSGARGDTTRRTSDGELVGGSQWETNNIMAGADNMKGEKRTSVCINCRSLVGHQEPASLGPTCGQCRLKLNNASFGGRQEAKQQRAGAEPQSKWKQTIDYIKNNHKDQDIWPAFYKLSQSGSTNSLPAKAAKELAAAQGVGANEVARNNNDKNTSKDKTMRNNTIIVISDKSNQNNRSTSSKPPSTNKRLEIIREFIDTEKTHTDRLRCLDELFYRPLKSGGFLTNEQLRMVFSCHKTLYKIHRQIYRILLSANYNLYSEPMIGSALMEIFEGDLKKRLERASCSFCVAQSTNAELLNKLTRKDTKVGEFLAQVTSQRMVGRLGIKDLLASCFQRLTKYPLLLEILLKATPQSLEAFKASRAIAENWSGDLNEPAEKDNNQLDFETSREQLETPDDMHNCRRMLAISLAEEREFIERALYQSRQILVRVNESVKVATSHNKLKEIWKRTDKHPGVPLIDITKQQVVHEGLLTLRLSKRSFDVYVLLLNDYLIILTREGQDKYRLKFFTPEGKSSSGSNAPSVYSPVFVIDEHLTTRDAATDENGFYLLCKRKDDSRIYEFASRSPAERLKWRDRIQWTIERQILKGNRRASCESTITKSSSELSANKHDTSDETATSASIGDRSQAGPMVQAPKASDAQSVADPPPPPPPGDPEVAPVSSANEKKESAKIEGTISYVEDDGIVMPSKMESSRVLVDQAVQVNIFESSSPMRRPVPSAN